MPCPPSEEEQIAGRAGYHERRIRELGQELGEARQLLGELLAAGVPNEIGAERWLEETPAVAQPQVEIQVPIWETSMHELHAWERKVHAEAQRLELLCSARRAPRWC